MLLPPPTHNAPTHSTTRTAIQHQNMIGWENFMCGYISCKWSTCYHQTNSKRSQSPTSWSHGFLRSIMDLLVNIWTNRNQVIHGKNAEENRMKAREATIQKVKNMYQNPPKLAPRFSPITIIPLEQRIKRSTQQLKDWMTRVEHQKKVTAFLDATRPPGQLTIHQAFKNATARHDGKAKYPP